MKILVINGTEIKGCTYHIKESFLETLRENNEINEFYLPKDCPCFCCGCKTCFLKSELLCPHAKHITPIWEGILEADLLVFAYPVYALRAPGQMKSLLDHLCCHWMVHRPDKRMFKKRAVILTQSIGAPNRAAQKDVETSLTWLGVSNIKKLGFGLIEGVIWEEISEKRRKNIEEKTKNLAKKYCKQEKVGQSLKVKIIFTLNKMMHQHQVKKEDYPCVDNQYWIDNGWIKK